jgi:hypothetical protein
LLLAFEEGSAQIDGQLNFALPLLESARIDYEAGYRLTFHSLEDALEGTS